MRKTYSLFLILLAAGFFGFQPVSGGSNTHHQYAPAQDTLEFTVQSDFNGLCNGNCYVFLGSQQISRINGKPAGNSCNHLFIKCPTAVRLSTGKTYRFLAIPFRPNECSTVIDICNKNLYYELVSELSGGQ